MPPPVIETKKLLESGRVKELTVAVDNGAPRENVTRYLESQGYCVTVEKCDPQAGAPADTALLLAVKVERGTDHLCPNLQEGCGAR